MEVSEVAAGNGKDFVVLFEWRLRVRLLLNECHVIVEVKEMAHPSGGGKKDSCDQGKRRRAT